MQALAKVDGDREKDATAARHGSPPAHHGLTARAERALSWDDLPLIGDTGYDIATPLTAYNRPGRTPSSTTTCCGRAPRAARASSSAPSTSSTSTTSSTCGATRRSSSRRSRRSWVGCSRTSRARATRGAWARGRGSTGPRTCRSRSRCSARTSRRRRTSSGCSGSAAPAPTRTAPRRRPVRWPSCSTPPGCRFAVLGDGETCTGDSARRAGNELLFQTLAAAERRDLRRVRRHQGRRHLRALLQHDQERVRRRSAGPTRSCTTPSCSTGSCATRSSCRWPGRATCRGCRRRRTPPRPPPR